jgi:L-arabinose isomerase
MGSDRTTRVGIMPLYLGLYEEISPGSHETYRPYIDAIVGEIEAAGVICVRCGAVFTDEHVRHAARMFERERIEALIVLHLSYSPSLLVADYLENLDLPLLVVDSTPDATLQGNEPDYLRRNQGIHGAMDLTSVLVSRGRSFAIASGHRSGRLPGRLREEVDAIRAACMFRKQTIGITGEPFIGMGDFAVDFGILASRYDIHVKQIEVARIVEASNGLPSARVREIVAKDRERFDTSEITAEDHERAVRDALALSDIIDSEGMTGYSMHFGHIGESMPTPFYGCSMLISRGIGYGGEGDVLTASLGAPLNEISEAAKFDEFFSPDWTEQRIIMSHMGETDLRFARRDIRPKLVNREGFMNPHRSVILRFEAEPGEATFVNVSPTRDGRLRLVAGLLDIVQTGTIDAIIPPHYQVDPRQPVGVFLERYARAGGGHHLHIARGNIMSRLASFAHHLDIKLEVIDRSEEVLQ